MKPRSTVRALLAITESLLAARAAKAARTKSAQPNRTAPRGSSVARLLTESRPLLLRIKTVS